MTQASRTLLAPLVAAAPGRRVPRAVDGVELAVRAVLGPAAAARLAMAYGDPVTDPDGALTRVFPDLSALAGADPAVLDVAAPVAQAFAALVGAVASGGLDLGVGADWVEARRRLRDLPGLDGSTVEHIARRALGDPDAWPGDGRHGEPAERWRPWRAYAFGHLAG
ncbi:hypothetical protein ACFQO7_27795 [Catellatospora aurea]|uniref:Uncharacterized protein n=1 Tax=Catellatospora aurea TaxID=1337874 RepID=A0ABW2H365_9ACTN